MTSYQTEAAELTRRYRVAEHVTHHRDHGSPRSGSRRTRVATTLRRAADRLEQ